MPAVGPYSLAATDMSIVSGRLKHPEISSSTSGAPWPRLAQASGSSRKPYSEARSVHQTTPVEERLASRPACGRWPSWAFRNWRWILDWISGERTRACQQLLSLQTGFVKFASMEWRQSCSCPCGGGVATRETHDSGQDRHGRLEGHSFCQGPAGCLTATPAQARQLLQPAPRLQLRSQDNV